MKNFKQYFNYKVLLESPQGKIQKFKLTDPSFINFIYRYESMLDWNKIKTTDDLNTAIEYKVKELVNPENYHLTKKGINWDKERAILKAAAEAGNEQAQYSLEAFNNDPEAAKIRTIKDLNDGKDSIVKDWVNYFKSNDTYNKPFEFIILNSLLKKAEKSRNPPLTLNTNTLARIYDKIQENPKGSVNIKKAYDSFLKQDIENTSETVISGKGTWVKIPGSQSDPENIDENVKKLMSLSASNWCVCQKGMASSYLDERGDDFWLYLVDDKEGNKTAVASVRVNNGNIEEISGTEGGSSQNLHDKYLPVVSDLVEEKDFTGKDIYILELLTKQKKFDKIEKLIKNGVIDINATDEDEQSLLHLTNNIDVMKLLLKHGANPNARMRTGGTPIYRAGNSGNIDGVKLLLKHGADPNLTGFGQKPPLYWPTIHGHSDVVKLLIQNGADPKFVDKSTNDTLILMAQGAYRILRSEEEDSLETIKTLLQNGADPNIVNNEGISSLGLASTHEKYDLVKLLLKYGANPNIRVASDQNWESGQAPIIIAAARGYFDIVKLLLQNNANPNDMGNGFDSPPLYWAAFYKNADLVRILINAGADVTYADDESNVSPLSWGAYNIQDDIYNTNMAEDWADKIANPEIVKLLLDAGASPNSMGLDGMSILFYCLSNNEVLSQLLEAGADANAIDINGDTLISRAAHFNLIDTVKLLLKYGAIPDTGLNKLGINNDEMLQLLLKHGATHPNPAIHKKLMEL